LIQVRGHWYPSESAARYPAGLLLDDNNYVLQAKGQGRVSGFLFDLKFSERVGNIPRKMILPDGSVFETADNDAIDDLLRQTRHASGKSSWLHRLETHWRWIASALVLTAVISFSAVYWGLPWASKALANEIPLAVTEKISQGTLATLDKLMLSESGLSESRRQEITERFEKVLVPANASEDFAYHLHFRSMGDANAFALPSGDIVITDELIKMAKNQDEIDSVLLHEIGHVEHRHGMQQIIRSSFATIAITMISGDVTAVEDWVVAFPVFLMDSQYSRNHEAEADEYAFQHMMEKGMDPIAFAQIMGKIGSVSDDRNKELSNIEKASEYLSSHPASEKRMQRAKEYSQRFNQ